MKIEKQTEEIEELFYVIFFKIYYYNLQSTSILSIK